MQPDLPNTTSSSFLRQVLLHLLVLGIVGLAWSLFVGPEGFLIVCGAYLVALSGKLFLAIFGRPPKQPATRQPPLDT